jgi:hypothetical protein
VATIVIGIQKIAYMHSGWIREISGPVNYSLRSVWWLGPLMGAGALFGDAIESFFKRQVNISAGRSLFPFDQIDYIVGGCLFSYAIIRLSLTDYLLILLTWFVIHVLATYLGNLLGIRKRPI